MSKVYETLAPPSHSTIVARQMIETKRLREALLQAQQDVERATFLHDEAARMCATYEQFYRLERKRRKELEVELNELRASLSQKEKPQNGEVK
jgi:hypothetical protein